MIGWHHHNITQDYEGQQQKKNTVNFRILAQKVRAGFGGGLNLAVCVEKRWQGMGVIDCDI